MEVIVNVIFFVLSYDNKMLFNDSLWHVVINYVRCKFNKV